MRARGQVAALLALGVSLAGCRAQVGAPDDLGDAGEDMSANVDGDGGEADLAGDASGCAPPGTAEICGNGCDDDGNGYTDADDPACSTQLLVTTQTTSPSLSRLILEPMPKLAAIDLNMVNNGGMAMLDHALAPNVAYLVFTANTAIERLTLSPTGMGTATNYTTNPNFVTRDVCSFNGELIVVERGQPSVLHRFLPDGQTTAGTVSLGNVLATSCASDGKLLYVAVHDVLVGVASTFQVYDTSYNQVGSPIPIPAGIANYGGAGNFDRCMDFAWTPRSGFWGLFVQATTANDNLISGGQLFPFAFDGGSGAPVDAGVYYGVGTFQP